MLTTLPLEAFVCREVIETYFFPTRAFSWRRHILLTTAHVAAPMLLALLTCDLGAVFELIGATSACALAYILPPLCYLRLASRSWRTVPAIAIVAFGCLVLAVSVIQAMWALLGGGGEEGTKKVCS